MLGDGGQKYGPADVATLNQWITEGRLLPQTIIEEEATGRQTLASALHGLQFPLAAPPAAGPAPVSNYPRYDQAQQYRPAPYQTSSVNVGGSDFALALAMGLISPVLSILLPIGGLLTAGIGIRAAVRAQGIGHKLGILVIVINILAIGFWVVTRLTGMGRGIFLR